MATKKATGSAKKGPPKGVQRVGDRGTKGTGSAGLTATKKPGGAKKSPR